MHMFNLKILIQYFIVLWPKNQSIDHISNYLIENNLNN